MRRMSIERRRVVAMGGATAAISGLGGLLHGTRPQWEIAWMVLVAAMCAATIWLLVRWKKQSRRTSGEA